MSKDLHLSVHGMFYPYLELYTFWIYKGYLVERYSSCDWIYYFDKERRIRISEHILEHGNNNVERIEKENGQLSRIISSSRHYKNEKIKDYDELIFKSNEVCAEWNTFTTKEEIINGLKKCFFSDRKVKVIIGG